MKLVKVYADKPFHSIKFKPGFNVILGIPKERKDNNKHTHNLGKSLLVDVLDFLMLKKINVGHLFEKHKIFKDYTFYLEIQLDSGEHLVIRRGVEARSKISFKVLHTEIPDYREIKDWDHEKIPFKKAVDQLNMYLGFDVAGDWHYRKSISYFLRNQKDYQDVYQLSKYNKGKHRDWKPFLFEILGFDSKALKEKYEIEEKKQELEKNIENLKKEFAVSTEEVDKIHGVLEVKTEEKVTLETKIDKFNFYLKDKELNQQLVERIDSEISRLNSRRYNITEEIERLEHALKTKVTTIDTVGLKKLYEEVRIYFPDNLVKDYNELEAFNTKISKERRHYMNERLTQLKQELEPLENELQALDDRKSEILSVLKDKDSYQKFKHYQKELAKIEGEIIRYEEKLQKIDRLIQMEHEVEEYVEGLKERAETIKRQIAKSNDTYKQIRHYFNQIIQSVLNSPALITTTLNKKGNVDFHADIQDREKLEITAEAAGTTFKKLLCIAFDLAVLIAYSKNSFYKFVYHDGALETLDDRVKRKFINTVRDICHKNNLQYILTVIDSDIPHDDLDNRLVLPEDEIVLTLHDRDDSGRLFKMAF
ncbi:MAG: DUF2326 domain-containing protein [bacterium]|nr:DUF2326 domain-containing protein [bacterium]